MKKIINWLLTKWPHATISTNGLPYLTRWYVLGKDWKWFNIYLHKFHKSDFDLEFHNHPWSFFISLILSGGYDEFRWDGTGKIWNYFINTFVKLDINYIRHDDFHFVQLLGEIPCWTLSIAGPRKYPDWEFLDRYTLRRRHWSTNSESIQ